MKFKKCFIFFSINVNKNVMLYQIAWKFNAKRFLKVVHADMLYNMKNINVQFLTDMFVKIGYSNKYNNLL